MLLLGLDVGTTGAKAMVFDEAGAQRGYGFCEYGVVTTENGYVQQDAEEIWRIAKRVMAQAAQAVGREIGAISVSVQGDAVLGIDRQRVAVTPVQLGMDYRGVKEAAACGALLGDRHLFEVTGMRPHPMNAIVKVLWMQRHQPEIYEKVWKFVTYSDFILAKLGSDEIVIDYTQASRTMAFDLRGRQWSDEILDALDIKREKLAKPVPSGTIVGRISASLAAEVGIRPGAFLVTGGHDQTCAALGAGIAGENMALDSHGTAEVLSMVFSNPRLGSKMYKGYYSCYLHLLPDRYFSFSLNHTGGMLLKWFAEKFCAADFARAGHAGESIYQYLFERMQPDPARVMVLPYFNGSGTPTCDLGAKGAFLGMTLATDRFELAKAIVESLSFELRMNLNYLNGAGIQIDRLRAVGGGARSPAGLQNKADILGIPVSSLRVREAACLGAALSAGLAMGVYAGPEQATDVAKVETTYEPDPRRSQMYERRFEIYAQLYSQLKPISQQLSCQ